MKKYKISYILSTLICTFLLFSCSNLIENLKGKPAPDTVSSNPYLTFKGNGAFELSVNSKRWNGTVEYSTNKTNWNVWDGTTSIPAAASNGSYFIYLRGKGNTSFISNYSNYTTIGIIGTATSVECNGNIMTLLDWENPDTVTMTEGCFYRLFNSCEKLTKAPDLPSMNLSDACYMNMFEGCTALVTAPDLPATTLTDGCYFCMFSGCTSLTSSPALPATTVTVTCYNLMFNGCTSLRSIGKISAKVIDKNSAMNSMFHSCSNIKVVETSNPDEAFLTIESADGTMAVYDMFANTKAGGVTEPTEGKSYKVEIPFVASNYLTFKGNDTFILELNTGASKAWDGTVYYSTDKTTWKEWNKTDDSKIASSAVSGGKAYIYLAGKDNSSFVNESFEITNFYLSGNASSVECNGNIMALLDCENPGTVTMGDYCFMYLFMDCDKLTKAPSLPATTLSMGCYGAMFQNCSNLTEAPALPATTLKVNCYAQMFSGCTALETAPVLNALSLAEECYSEMFSGCTSLTSSPALPATVLETQCFESMFSGCTSLRSIGKISATNLDKQRVMFEMFKNCSSIKVVETTVTEEAFLTISSITETQTVSDMFSGCMTGSITQPSEGKSYKYVIE